MSGERMASEMVEQPAWLRLLVDRFDEVATLVGGRAFHGVTIVARGSSGHAATYGRYLLEAASGKPISMAAPSLHTLYKVDANYRGQLVVAVSQSGRTPEIVETMRRLSDAGAWAVAITNDASSSLARASDGVLVLGVGEELAVPATKTVTAQMMVFALLALALGVVPFSLDDLAAVGSHVQSLLDDWAPAEAAAEALANAEHLIVVARGYLYGAALEIALKIKETCSLLADGYSAADLRHGPIAAVTRGLPVVALNAPGPASDDVACVCRELRDRGARVLSVSPNGDVPLPADLPEALAPMLAVVRGQQLAFALARRLGFDPDAPEGLSKVTAT